MTSPQRFLDIADALETELQSVPVGSRVPSEHALAARFSVSRPTARAALEELQRRMLVRRVQGLGTFRRGRVDYVIAPDVPPSFTETVRRAGARASVRLRSVSVRRAVEQERRHLGLGVGAAIWVVERLYLVNGEPAGFATGVLPQRRLPGLDRALTIPEGAATGSLHRLLRRRYGHEVVRARYRLGFEVPPPRVANELTGGDRGPLWLAESTNRVRGGEPIEYARTYLRPDVLNVVFEIGEPAETAPRAGARPHEAGPDESRERA